MALNFTIAVKARQQFGDTNINNGVFVGREKSYPFDCPSISSDQALLLFQSFGAGTEQTLEINDVPVLGGVPATGPGWVGNVLIINQGVLEDSGNSLRIASDGNNFVIDNVVVVYKTRRPAHAARTSVLGAAGAATAAIAMVVAPAPAAMATASTVSPR